MYSFVYKCAVYYGDDAFNLHLKIVIKCKEELTITENNYYQTIC